MARVQIFLVLAVSLALFSTTQGRPFFWYFPWNYPSTSSGSSSGTSSTSSTATSGTPSNVAISIGDRTNTNATLDDYGTTIDGLTITTGRRRRSANQTADEDSALPSNESYIQIGNQVFIIPPEGISNVSISVVDGVAYVEQGEIPTTSTPPPSTNPGFFGFFRNFLDGFFNGANWVFFGTVNAC